MCAKYSVHQNIWTFARQLEVKDTQFFLRDETDDKGKDERSVFTPGTLNICRRCFTHQVPDLVSYRSWYADTGVLYMVLKSDVWLHFQQQATVRSNPSPGQEPQRNLLLFQTSPQIHFHTCNNSWIIWKSRHTHAHTHQYKTSHTTVALQRVSVHTADHLTEFRLQTSRLGCNSRNSGMSRFSLEKLLHRKQVKSCSSATHSLNIFSMKTSRNLSSSTLSPNHVLRIRLLRLTEVDKKGDEIKILPSSVRVCAEARLHTVSPIRSNKSNLH